MASVLTWCREQLGLTRNLRLLSKSHRPRDRRSVGEEPGFDTGMGDPDRGRIFPQLEVAPATELVQLTRVVSLGVKHIDESG
jgi:hypothetical protein